MLSRIVICSLREMRLHLLDLQPGNFFVKNVQSQFCTFECVPLGSLCTLCQKCVLTGSEARNLSRQGIGILWRANNVMNKLGGSSFCTCVVHRSCTKIATTDSKGITTNVCEDMVSKACAYFVWSRGGPPQQSQNRNNGPPPGYQNRGTPAGRAQQRYNSVAPPPSIQGIANQV